MLLHRSVREPRPPLLPPGQTRRFVLLFAIAFLAHFSNQVLSYSLPNYAHALGVPAHSVGLLSGIYAFSALLLRPLTGQIIDNENRIRLLRSLLLVLSVCGLCFSFSDRYWELTLLRGLYGLGWGLGTTLCMAIAAGFFSPAAMAAGLGIYNLGQLAAQLVGPAFALAAPDAFSYANLYRLNAAVLLLSAALSFFLRLPPQPKKPRHYSLRLSEAFYLPALLPAALLLCNSICRGALTAFLAIFAKTLGVEGIGLFFTLQAGTTFVLRPLLPRLLERFSERRILLLCEILEGAALFLTATASSLAQFLAAAVLLGASFAGSQPILTAACVSPASPEQRGRASNACYIGMDIGIVLGSSCAGFLVAAVGYRFNFLLTILPLAACSAVYFSRGRGSERSGGAHEHSRP